MPTKGACDIAVHKTHQLEERSVLGDHQQTLFSQL
jgi:hypothetical protein